MTKVTANKLVDLLRRSNLVDEAKLTAFLDKAVLEHGEAALEDQPKLAELMTEAGLITKWQADKLLARKRLFVSRAIPARSPCGRQARRP